MSFVTRHASLRARLGVAAAMGLCLGVAMSSVASAQAPARPAPAQQPQARSAAPAPVSGPIVVSVKGAPNSPDWLKQCGQEQAGQPQICMTVREFTSEDNRPALAVAMYEVMGEAGKPARRNLRLMMPLGLLLETGVRFSVDSAAYVPGKFQVCMPNGCFANIDVKDDLLKAMRSGKTFNVAVKNENGAEIVFAVPADGFGKIFDGKPVDPKVLEERERQRELDLQRRSEQLRKELSERGASGLPAPAAQAPKQ